MENTLEPIRIESLIYEIRGHKVMLDRDLAKLYGVETKVLNQAVKRNIKRFPEDFMFRLTHQEYEILKSQFVTSSWGGTRKLPFAFTEQGLAMLSGLLNSDIAIKVNIEIMRTFVTIRQYIYTTHHFSSELTAIKAKLEDTPRRSGRRRCPRGQRPSGWTSCRSRHWPGCRRSGGSSWGRHPRTYGSAGQLPSSRPGQQTPRWCRSGHRW